MHCFFRRSLRKIKVLKANFYFCPYFIMVFNFVITTLYTIGINLLKIDKSCFNLLFRQNLRWKYNNLKIYIKREMQYIYFLKTYEISCFSWILQFLNLEVNGFGHRNSKFFIFEPLIFFGLLCVQFRLQLYILHYNQSC